RLSAADASRGRIASQYGLGAPAIFVEAYFKDDAIPGEVFRDRLLSILASTGDRFGFRLPRHQTRFEPPAGKETYYAIYIGRDVPVVVQSLEAEAHFCPAIRAIDPILHDSVQSLALTFNPMTGTRDGAWVPQKLVEEVRRTGVELWDRADYIAKHLEGVLHGNL